MLIGVLVIALLITAIRWMQWQNRWRGIREDLREWAREVDRTDGKIEQFVRTKIYLNEEIEPTGTHRFTVLTGEAQKVVLADGTTDWTITPRIPEDPSRFFVIPPGIWVNDVDDVMTVWNDHYADGFHEP